jgi:hypothetical protein
MPRILRILGSLAGTIVAYLTYAAIAVPLIEPTAAKRTSSGTRQSTPSEHELPSTSSRFAVLFQQGDWERDQPVVLVAGSTALLLKEYEPQSDGRLRIRPCTIVMLPEGGEQEQARRLHEAVVLQAGEALLQFDRPLDLGQGQIGNLHLVAGQLSGEIVIRSDQKEAGPQDDLHIVTRDLQLQADRILGSNPVQFRLGVHSGRGTELVVHLAAGATAKRGKRGMSAGGVKSFELRRDIEMYLLVKSGGLLPDSKTQPANPSTDQQLGPAAAPCPLIITCQGPFTFDRERLVTTFHRHVEVVSQPSPGINDRLRNCDRLELQFVSAEESTTPPASSADEQQPKLAKLKPSRMEATGGPVVIEAPSQELSAWGQQLVFEAASDTIELSGDSEVMLRKAATEVHAGTIRFQRTAGGLGRMLASGRGWLATDVKTDPAVGAQGPQRMTAKWSNRLQVAEDPQDAKFQVISVLGDAQVDFGAMGGLDAREIYVWLFEPPAATDAPPVSMPGMAGNANLLPDRMQARGNVHLDSETLQGNVDELQAWFKFVALPAEVGGQRSEVRDQRSEVGSQISDLKSQISNPQPSTLNPQPSTNPQSAIRNPQPTPPAHPAVYHLPSPEPEELPPPKPPKRRFDAAGRLLQVELLVRGKEASPTHVVLDGRAELVSAPTSPNDKPLKVSGQRIEASSSGESQAVVAVTGRPPQPQDLNDRGQPAEVEINGMKLSGDNVQLDQAANRVWIEGPGVLEIRGQGLEVGSRKSEVGGQRSEVRGQRSDLKSQISDSQPSSLNLQPSSLNTVPLFIRWQGGMVFDGLKARFEKNVVAEQGEQWLSAPEAMDAVFTQKVDLTNQKSAGQPEIASVICHGRVELRRKSYDEQQRPAFEQLETGKLVMNRQSGEVQAEGPGKLHRIWLGDAASLPGGTAGTPFAANVSPAKPRSGPQLTFLSVKFARSLHGNFPQPSQRRTAPVQLTFSDRVVTAYGPVSRWDETIQPDQLLANQFTLSSEALSVRQMETHRAADADIELEANGAARIEGLDFFATGQRVTYTKSKDLLVLEGDGYSPAELYHQRAGVTGAPTAAARQIKFWISSNTVLWDGTRMLNLNQLPGAPKQ